MLTPEQIAALQDAAARVADPINDFLLEDIARRIAGAGQLTSTAAYRYGGLNSLDCRSGRSKKGSGSCSMYPTES